MDGIGGDATAIGRANLDGTGVDRNFITGLADPCGVAVDAQHIYWGNRDTNTIGRASLDGSGVNVNFIQLGTTTSGPCGPAIGGGQIWWANSGGGGGNGSVAHADIDGSDPQPTFFNSPGQAGNPTSVALIQNLVFWTNLAFDAPEPSVGRAGVDGTPAPVRNFIPFSAPFSPLWVAADGSRVYVAATAFLDFGAGIGRFDVDGNNAETVTPNSATGGLALHAGQLYWANALEGTISRSNPDGSSPEIAFISGAGNPFGLAVDAGIPGNDFSFGALNRNKRKGTAKLAVEVSNPGTLELEGNGLKAVTEEAADAGEFQLPIKATGSKKQKLNDRGKVKLEAEVTFSPTGGTPATEDKKVKLVKK